MQQFTQKYTIVQLLEEMPEGTEYNWKDWPLHVTIADVFAIDWDVPTLVEKLTKLLSNHKQATSMAADDALFGPEKQVRVVLLEKTDDLIKLHYDVVKMLEEGGFKPNNPQFVREGYLPHSTVQKHGRLHKGDAITFNALSIIDMFPNEDPYRRKILKTINIKPAIH